MKKKLPAAPKKLSAAIRLALDDLAKVERSKTYSVNMGVWHDPTYPEPKCTVCLAGAVMAGTLGVPPDRYASPSSHWGVNTKPKSFPLSWQRVLNALNTARSGYVNLALSVMHPRTADAEPMYIAVPQYSADRPGFKRAMRKMAKQLEGLGL